MSIVVLLNILIALFNTVSLFCSSSSSVGADVQAPSPQAYTDIYEDATNQYLGAYAFKTISMIRGQFCHLLP